MTEKPFIVTMDLEGVLVPEIWIAVSEKTGIEKLRLTTRDVPDYDELMRYRLKILEEHNLSLKDIQDVIATLDPLPGAGTFVDWLRETSQLIIMSDTYYEFAKPLMRKLKWPTLFCNSLIVDDTSFIANYRLRQKDGKKHAVAALKSIGFYTISVGDSYNDVTMLAEADVGILFNPSEKVIKDYPRFPVMYTLSELKKFLIAKLPNS